MGDQYNTCFFNLNIFVSTQVTQLFRSKWLTGGTKIRPNFLGKMTQFFLLVHREKKLSHFDLKSWVIGEIKIRPNFLGQNDSIFSLSAPREKIESLLP